MPVPRAARIKWAMESQSWAVNIISAMKQSIPAKPATSTRFGWLKLYAHNEGLPLKRFASSRSLDSVGKSKSHLFRWIIAVCLPL